MGGCGSTADKDMLARDLDRIAREKAIKRSECELRLQTDDGDLPVVCVRGYLLETAGALLARQAERLGLPADGLVLKFSNELVPAECVLEAAGIMEGATVRVLGVPATRLLVQKLRRTDLDIHTAVEAWLSDPVRAEAEYGHIASWDVSAVTDMSYICLSSEHFNEDLSKWDVSNVTNMQDMFKMASSFNQDLSGWDVSSVTDMYSMFNGASSFDQDLSGWDVSNVTNMDSMFYRASSFNHDLSGWDVSAVTSMRGTFAHANSFNQDLGGWDVSSVTDMYSMFNGARSFDQDLSGWDVSNVTNMRWMFSCARSFDQNLSGWDVSGVVERGQNGKMIEMFSGSKVGKGMFNCSLPRWYK